MAKNNELGSFSDLASIKGNQVEKPKNLPDSPYSAIITGPFKEHKARSGNVAMRFPVKLTSALDDDAVTAIASDERMQKALEREYKLDFWMSPDARWRFTEFCKSMGISDDLNLLEMAEQLVANGQEFMVQGKSSGDDPDNQFFNIDNPAPLTA